MPSGMSDVLVVGLGVVGAATAWQLAQRGLRVTGIDQFSPPHELGSSHGQTRVTREAYFEQPDYVPLVRRAREHWLSLERRSGRQLLRTTGVLNLGPAGGRVAEGAAASAHEHGVAIEILDAGAVQARFPGLRPDAEMVGVYEPGGGLLFPEACVAALHDAARAAGASLCYGERVVAVEQNGESCAVQTSGGRLTAARVVLAAGPWMADLLPDLELPLTVERQVMSWFSAPPHLHAARCPVTLWEVPDGSVLYTCPDVGHGVKAALHHGGVTVHPDNVDRSVSDDDVTAIRGRLGRYLPDADGVALQSTVCLYTNTPDHDFLIDRHPQDERIVIASPCSGHGFKFGTAVGEIVVDLVQDRDPAHDVSRFLLKRFSTQACDAAPLG